MLKQTTGDLDGAFDVNGEVGVHERYFVKPVALDKFRYFTDHAIRLVSIEPPLVEDLVGAVIARVRTPDARGITHFALAPDPGVGVIVHQVTGRGG